MKRLVSMLLLAAALAPAAPAGARVVLLRPGPEGEDVAPYSFLPAQRRPNNETQWAFHAIDPATGFDHAMETFLRFALPADLLLPGEVITQAVFWIYYTPLGLPPIAGEPSTAPGELWCHEVTESWSESTLTWNNRPDYDPEPFDGLASVTHYGLIWCNATELVLDWISGARPNDGIALTNATARPISFYSFETPSSQVDPNFRPSLAIEIVAGDAQPDADGDGIADAQDVCLLVADPDQRDSDADGYGNPCDADFDGDGAVGLADFGWFRSAFASALGDPAYDPDADLDGDGGVGLADFGLMRAQFGAAPGPSGLACAGAPPCP